jgi:hypothetical protein
LIRYLESGVALGPLRSDGTGCYKFAFAVGDSAYTISISRDPLLCELIALTPVPTEEPIFRDESISVEGRRICRMEQSIKTSANRVDIFIDRLTFFPGQDRLAGLLSMSQRATLNVPRHGRMQIWSVGFDEWLGLIAIQWWADDREQELDHDVECFATIIRIPEILRHQHVL